jgi:predicted alpha/beta hydrolase family esterase
MVKRVFLVHGWGGSPETDFFVWLRGELKNNGFEVYAPAMPDTEKPIIEKWVSHLRKEVGKPNKSTYFI